MAKKKKRYVEDHIFRIYPDYPIMVLNNISWSKIGSDDPLHFHYYLEIGYCYEGNGEIISEECCVPFKKGSVSVIAPNYLHATRNKDGTYTKWGYLFIDLEDLMKLFPGTSEYMQKRLFRQLFHGIQILNTQQYSEIKKYLIEIFKLSAQKQGSYKSQIIGLVYTMLHMLYDILSADIKEGNITSELTILPAIEYIYDHYMEKVLVKELASLCHFSESHFRKIFLEMKGLTPLEYLNCIRIREACRMLQNTKESIRLIGEKCGYQSVTSFERNFKNRIGMLPSQWRETQRDYVKNTKANYDIKKIYYE